MEQLSIEIIGNFRSAIQLLTGYKRREYVAALSKQYFGSSARKTERVLGVSRKMAEKALKEQQIGIRCIESFGLRGRKKKKWNLPL